MAAATSQQIAEVTLYTIGNAKQHSAARKAAIAAYPECEFDGVLMLEWIDKNFPKNPAALAKIALGQISRGNVAESTPYALETVPTPTQTETTRVQAHKTSNKMKDKAIRGATAELVHIRTPDNQRKAIWLEPDFYDALQIVVQPENQPKWLTNVLVDAWGDATESKGTGKGTGKEKANLASAVRCAIVKALVNRATQAEDTIYLKGIESGLSEEWNGADDEAFKQLTNNPKVFLKDTV